MTAISSQNPTQAWDALEQNPLAILLDVRDRVEFALVGHAPSAVNIPWKHAPDWESNPAFIDEVCQCIPNRETPIFLICRSGQRSMDAAKALAAKGYSNLTNIEEGFEGPLDGQKHRNSLGGWRYRDLPWIQS